MVMDLTEETVKSELEESRHLDGSTTNVRRVSTIRTGVLVSPKLASIDVPYDLMRNDYLDLNLSIEEAKALREKLSLLVIVDPTFPYIESMIDTDYDSRIRHWHDYQVVVGNIVGLWIYDYETGALISRL